MRGVGCVPRVVEGGEGRGAVLGAEEEVAFCFVGLEICLVFASVSSDSVMWG